MEDKKLQKSKKWLDDLSKGAEGINELEALTVVGLQVIHAHKGFFLCNFIVPNHLSEEVELEAEIVGDMGKLICVVVKVTRKENGELVALGKQWLASFSMKTHQSPVTSRL